MHGYVWCVHAAVRRWRRGGGGEGGDLSGGGCLVLGCSELTVCGGYGSGDLSGGGCLVLGCSELTVHGGYGSGHGRGPLVLGYWVWNACCENGLCACECALGNELGRGGCFHRYCCRGIKEVVRANDRCLRGYKCVRFLPQATIK